MHSQGQEPLVYFIVTPGVHSSWSYSLNQFLHSLAPASRDVTSNKLYSLNIFNSNKLSKVNLFQLRNSNLGFGTRKK